MAGAGCCGRFASKPPTTRPAAAGLTPLRPIETVDAWCDPPTGWRREPLRKDAQHEHEIWISPSEDTAYGVVVIYLPLPVGSDLILWGFLNHLRQKEHEATLISKQHDDALPGMRFVAESAKYRLRVNLIVHGWRAWAVYAGTLKSKPLNARELALAEQAREQTRVGLPPAEASTK